MNALVWQGKTLITWGDIHQAVVSVTSPEEAQAFKAAYEAVNPAAAENIGYTLGYEDRATRHRLNDWFDVEHPLFGRHDPDIRDAFEAGKLMAEGSSLEDIKTLMGWT